MRVLDTEAAKHCAVATTYETPVNRRITACNSCCRRFGRPRLLQGWLATDVPRDERHGRG